MSDKGAERKYFYQKLEPPEQLSYFFKNLNSPARKIVKCFMFVKRAMCRKRLFCKICYVRKPKTKLSTFGSFGNLVKLFGFCDFLGWKGGIGDCKVGSY